MSFVIVVLVDFRGQPLHNPEPAGPLVMLEQDELDFYRTRALALSALRGRSVERKGRVVGTLRDVVLGADGELVAVIVARDGVTERMSFDDAVRLAPETRSAA